MAEKGDTSQDSDGVVPSTSDFDPLRAIYDPNYETESDTNCHDNVEKCVAWMEGRWRQKPEKSKAAAARPEAEPLLERQFLPEQMAVRSRGRKQFRHVLRRMEEFTSVSGPLFVLRQCRDQQARVKVWTRGPAGVRGVLTGFIAAFDKVTTPTSLDFPMNILHFQHWNLALTDVDEQFTRRRARKAPVRGGTEPRSAPGPAATEAREWRVGESVVRILKLKRKVEVCVRHAPQLLLRGEHVVMVARQETADTADGEVT